MTILDTFIPTDFCSLELIRISLKNIFYYVINLKIQLYTKIIILVNLEAP